MNPATILIIQHVEPEPPSRIAVAIDRAGAKMHVVRVDRGDAVPASIGTMPASWSWAAPWGCTRRIDIPTSRSNGS
jgi:hypothetical protein